MLNQFMGLPEAGTQTSIQPALAAIRKHLGMEIAYISEFGGDRSTFTVVDAPGLEAMIKVGDSHSLDDVYCRHILEGRLPQLMADTADYELATSMPITAATPIGAHMSVPIRGEDGSALGMFCCLSPHANTSLNDRDLQVMRVFADMVASHAMSEVARARTLMSKQTPIEDIIRHGRYRFAYQPIWEFHRARPAGFEALCRFEPEPYRSPDKWFDQAFEVGLGVDLECAVLKRVLGTLGDLPGSTFLSVNASPDTVLSGRLNGLLAKVPMQRVVLEITEHAKVGDYDALVAALAPLRAAGGRLAIDDAGAGYSSLKHIIQLQPDVIKLDIGLTRAIDTDPARRALASALIYFAAETGCSIVAEGIETATELATLRELGVPKGQGYLLGRPSSLQDAQAMCGRELELT